MSPDVLLKSGFASIGRWAQISKKELKLEAKAPTDPGVYAFTADHEVVYVGLTNKSLRARLDLYRHGHQGQRTNARVKALIIEALSGGQTVTVLVATPPRGKWKRLPVITAAGLEAGLIELSRPVWNIAGAK